MNTTEASNFYAVYYKKDGSTFEKVQDNISTDNFKEHNDVVKVELFENIKDQSPKSLGFINNNL